ncbi:MAG TPA: ubiquinol oxidase subunit II [Solidesulfovibrio magneticus]|nr:ubiquinol oxidase subunit II [Solidesulfovibrio magneticus]
MKRNTASAFAAVLGLCALAALSGCSELALLDPKGPIGEAERRLIFIAFGLMLIVVIPVIVMAVWFPHKYRESNTEAEYAPKWSHSGRIELVMWLIPMVIVILLSTLLWIETHRLDPYKPLAAPDKQLPVEVVSLDWKWLFIYPQQGVAVVNELVFPAGMPLAFDITSDTVMTSFFIPRLGSQIYAMGGMRTKLHLLADTEGEYVGQNQQFSGAGYPDMFFPARAVSQAGFDAWLQKVKASPDKLDMARFDELRKPGLAAGPVYFSKVEPGIFEAILGKYDPMTKQGSPQPAGHSGHGGYGGQGGHGGQTGHQGHGQ